MMKVSSFSGEQARKQLQVGCCTIVLHYYTALITSDLLSQRNV